MTGVELGSKNPLCSGLRETVGRFPLTRNLSLEEAEAAVKTPPAAEASFPFRTPLEEESRRPSSPRPAGLKRKRTQSGPQPREGGPSRVMDTEDEEEFPTAARSQEPVGGSRAKKGTRVPVHDHDVQKYACELSNSPVYDLLKFSLAEKSSSGKDRHNRNLCVKLVAASLAKSTWKRYNSAFALWKVFCKEKEKSEDIRKLPETKRDFILWCWERRRLAVNTIKIYWAELKNLKFLVDELESGGQGLEKHLFRGMENLGFGGKRSCPSKTVPLTVDHLHTIRDHLGTVTERLTAQSVWTCCLVAFWGAFRLGELLGRAEAKFDKFSDLLWEDIDLEFKKATIRVKAPKTRGPPGNRAIVYRVSKRELCPVAALSRLLLSQKNLGVWESNLPVFRVTGGNVLTKPVFLDWVNRAIGRGKTHITGKSFRSAIPSAMESFPTCFKDSHAKVLGRWKGNSYQLYMRNDSPEFQRVFGLVEKTLLSGVLLQERKESPPSSSTEPCRKPTKSCLRQPARNPKKRRGKKAGPRTESRRRI